MKQEAVECINLAGDTAVVITVMMTLWLPQHVENSLSS
jgi:hypothetical protein